MAHIEIADAGGQIVQLVGQVSKGEEVLVLREHTEFAKIVPTPAEAPLKGGFDSGKYPLIYMADGFDAPMILK